MDMGKLTQKAQEAVQAAHALAVRGGHQEVDGEHMLLALLEQEQGLIPGILTKIGAAPTTATARLQEELGRRPRVSGSVETGKLFVTHRFNHLIVKAQDEAKQLRDEYVSVEHFLLAFTDEGKQTAAGRILADLGVDRAAVLEALRDIRGNQRVTTDNPEGQYEALTKYGVDLVELARKGKLDPVIGRDAEIRSVIRILSRKTKNNPVLRTASCAATCPRGCRTARSSPWT